MLIKKIKERLCHPVNNETFSCFICTVQHSITYTLMRKKNENSFKIYKVRLFVDF